MEIAIIGYYGFYGSICEWVADAFESNGHTVTRYDRNKLPNINTDHQIYLFVDCSEDYSYVIPQLSGTKVFWSMDSGMPDGIERSTNISRRCDIVFSSNYERGVLLLRKFGIDSYLLPVTYSENLLSDAYYHKKDIDIVMIGNPNSPQRVELWNIIKAKYPNSFVGRAETRREYVSAMNRAKIVINQPTEPFDNILNNRLFEAMASGALLLQKRLKTTLIEDLGFNDGIDFIYWEDIDDLSLFPLIDYYLSDKKMRDDLTESAYRMVKQYSMNEQCKKMEYIIKQKLLIR